MSAAVHPVDETASFAQRTGRQVRIVLALPEATLEGDVVAVRFRAGDDRFRRPGAIRRASAPALVEVLVPRRRLGREVWNLALRHPAEGGFVRVRARLLAFPGHPVALLPGPAPATRRAEPVPNLLVRFRATLRAGLGRVRRARADRGKAPFPP